jgi:hypothetical protein
LGEALRDGVAAIVDAQRPALHALLESALAGAEGVELDLHGGLLDSRAQSAAAVAPGWTSIDNVHLIGVFLPGVAGLLGRVVGGVLDRGKGERDRAEAYRQQLAEAMPGLRTEAEALLANAYAALGEQLRAQLGGAGERLREAGGAVREAQQAHAEGAESIAARRAGLVEARAALREADSALAALRVSLGGQG